MAENENVRHPVLRIRDASGNVRPITAIVGEKGEKGERGDNGENGDGIASIQKAASSGLKDTYTITTTHGNAYSFTVTNGEKGEPGNYTKPTDGIPKTDLKASVQTSLGKADTALQTQLPVVNFNSNNRATLEGLTLSQGTLLCVVFSIDVGGSVSVGGNGTVYLNGQMCYVRWLGSDGSIYIPPVAFFKKERGYLFRVRRISGVIYLVTEPTRPVCRTEMDTPARAGVQYYLTTPEGSEYIENVTINLSSEPTLGDEITVVFYNGPASGANVTLAGSIPIIGDAATYLPSPSSRSSIRLVYDGTCWASECKEISLE